jgi:hypothetical protein
MATITAFINSFTQEEGVYSIGDSINYTDNNSSIQGAAAGYIHLVQ